MVDYSSKKQPIPCFFSWFFFCCFFVLFLLCILFARPGAGLHLDALHGLFDVLQQRLVLRALVLVLVGVHVSQCTHIRVKVLFVHRLLRRGERAVRRQEVGLEQRAENIRQTLLGLSRYRGVSGRYQHAKFPRFSIPQSERKVQQLSHQTCI